MIKFYGDLTELKERVERCEVPGLWRYIASNDLHQFKAETRENLNWWPSNGTITFQGGNVSVLQDRYELRYLPSEVRRANRNHG